MADKIVLLLDGGFIKKKLQERLNRFPTVADVVVLATPFSQSQNSPKASYSASIFTMRLPTQARSLIQSVKPL